MKSYRRCLPLLLAWFALASARGALLLFEPFNYTNGPLVTVSAGLWNTHSGTTGQVDVVSGRADLNESETEDVNVLVPGQPYSATTNTTLYASFTMKSTNLPNAAGQYFAHFKGTSTSNFRAKIFLLTSGASAGTFRAGLANNANLPVATNAVDLNLNTDYRVYLRYGISNATATLWVDPSDETSPSITATDTTSAATLTSFALRQDTGIGAIELDDVRIGTTFADVYSAPALVPPSITQQPASAGVIEGGTASFSVSATGTAPLSYHWQLNNTNLAGQTNPVLTLSSVTLTQAGAYSVVITNAAGSTNSATAVLTIFPASSNGFIKVVQYNMKGNFAADWSTNAPQVQAIARELQYLNPDIMTLNEIPNGLRYEMTNWMIAFFPGYNLAISTGTDGAIRNGIITRFAIQRTNSWFDGASLTNFGYNGTFTRDMFEAQLAVPNYPQPFHVFVTHLKSGTSSSDDAARRAAEASVISNYFVTGFPTTNSLHPYYLAGDMNEDILIPATGSQQPIQRLTNGTGLILTTPLNPYTLTNFTHSIQSSNGPTHRYDYILPGPILYSNIVSSQVFRTDLLNPVPLNLNSNDDIVASDHLPVVMLFANPYDKPFRLLSTTRSNQTVTLTWQSVPGQPYAALASTNLATWTVLATNLTATGYQHTLSTNVPEAMSYFRVYRQP